MTFPVSHKTVFVLDHSPSFLEYCRQQLDYDVFTKTRQPGLQIPLAPISKTLWTCTVEGAIEYCRIVWDIYPRDKLIRFLVSNKGVRVLNTWSLDEQNTNFLMASLAHLGPPPSSVNIKDCSIMHGLSAAIEALCQCSDVQHEKRTSLTESASKVVNRGRVICVTNLKNDNYARSVEECFLEALIQHNKLAASTDNLIPIHFCELVLINTYHVETQSSVSDKPRRELSALLSSEIHSIKSGRNLPIKMCQMVLRHYNLASTTVTGIPMKEEQNANSSANYDVELLHPSDAHSELVRSGCSGSNEGVPIRTIKEGAEYETVTLKWCTPRTSATELQLCTSMYRISPMDVNSRPSSCLTNFLLNGRAVMLEMPRKSGSKVMSHMLASHGGEIFIHTLATTRSILEDPPSISEGCGGRVTDYRINDFGEFMKQAKLVPQRKSLPEHGALLPIEIAKKNLERLTRYWPMTISTTTIFNMTQVLEPLISLITREALSEDEVLSCKKVIFDLVGMDSRNDALPIPSMGTRGKGPKREEQYRVLWNELETLVRAHCHSDAHNKVLDCLLTCHKPYAEVVGKTTPGKEGTLTITVRKNGTPTKDEKTTGTGHQLQDTAWKELERYNKMTEREKLDFNTESESKVKRPVSPPIKRIRMAPVDAKGKATGPRSLLSMWTSRINAEHAKKHVEFTGRATADGNVAKLYLSLEENKDG